jgi:NADH-quinone oxidoreductase subunit F
VEPVLLRNRGIENSADIDVCLERGGYEAAKKALKQMKPEEVQKEVDDAVLRGRGGAGFPAGLKWKFLDRDPNKTRYLCCNADESEPGTFKDRVLIETDPHQLIEGIIVSCYALGVHTGYIYLRGEYANSHKILGGAIAQARERGFLGENVLGSGFNVDIHLHKGAGAYICGEESAMLESLGGGRGWPRLKPPYPATRGVFYEPTVINNVETLACVPHIVLRGADWFKSLGNENNYGPKLYCLSGHVERPGVYEYPMGVTLRELIYEAGGGIPGGRKLKAILPGGTSSAVLTADDVDVAMDFDSVSKAGSMLGSAGIIVMDDSTCMVNVCWNVARFYAHESCGQCTPCREGANWVARILGRIEGGDGKEEDMDMITKICDNMLGQTICALADGAVFPIRSITEKFAGEFERHIRGRSCPFGADKKRRLLPAES